MALTRKRSSAAAAVTKSAIAQASTMLKQLPEKPKNNWSLREAVSMLQESITAALDRGYSYEEVAVLLGKQGVSIAAPSLKRYLAAVKRDRGSTRRGGRKSGKATLASSSLASVANSLEATPVAKRAGAGKRQPKTTGRAAAPEPKVAAKKAKATPTATAKTTATKVTTTKTAAAKTATRGRRKSAS